jgi:hypothetical protein
MAIGEREFEWPKDMDTLDHAVAILVDGQHDESLRPPNRNFRCARTVPPW